MVNFKTASALTILLAGLLLMGGCMSLDLKFKSGTTAVMSDEDQHLMDRLRYITDRLRDGNGVSLLDILSGVTQEKEQEATQAQPEDPVTIKPIDPEVDNNKPINSGDWLNEFRILNQKVQ